MSTTQFAYEFNKKFTQFYMNSTRFPYALNIIF